MEDSGRAPLDLRHEEGALLASPRGMVSAGWDVRWLDALARAAGLGLPLLVDLREASLDLGGAGSLLKLKVWADQLRTRLALFGPSPALVRVLRTTELLEALDAFSTESEALAFAGGVALPPASLPPGSEPPAGWAGSPVSSRAEPPLVGRRAVGPLSGFGQLWEHVHRVRLPGAPDSAEAVSAVWREEFGAFWPPGNTARPGGAGIRPGEVVAFTLAVPAGLPLSTGAVVLYADERSFGFGTLEGHVQAGWIVFSVYREDQTPVAEVRSLVRAGDPLYDAGLSLVGQHFAEQFWQRTLESLAARFGVRTVAVSTSSCLDSRRQWSRAANARHNAGVEGLFYGALGFARRFLPGRQ